MNFDFFFFNDTATTEIYTLSLHDALPIYAFTDNEMKQLDSVLDKVNHETLRRATGRNLTESSIEEWKKQVHELDRKSTRLNSSHANISYAVFCLKKKKLHKDLSVY